jgi:hypothetical protein
MKGKARSSRRERQALSDDVAATYDAFKEFEGRRYTGMRVGRSHERQALARRVTQSRSRNALRDSLP